MNMDEIDKLVTQMDSEANDIRREAIRMCWYMRGMSYSESFQLSFDERKIISDLVQENMDTTKKSGLPFF